MHQVPQNKQMNPKVLTDTPKHGHYKVHSLLILLLANTTMKLFLLLVFFLGVAMMLANELVQKPPVRIEYRYVSKDLDTYLHSIPALSETHGAMFLNPPISAA